MSRSADYWISKILFTCEGCMHLPDGINFSGYNSSSILGELPRNGKAG